jgi:hypothetical protein
VMDEICEYMTCQCAVHRRSFHLTGWKRPVSMMAGVRAGGRLSARAKNRAGCACRRNFAAPPAPRTLLSVVSRCCPGMRVLSGISSCKADR